MHPAANTSLSVTEHAVYTVKTGCDAIVYHNFPIVYLSNYSSASFFALFWHPCSYVPAQPLKKQKPFTQKFDYSQIKSRIDVRRPGSLPSSKSAFSYSDHSASYRSKRYRSTSPVSLESRQRSKIITGRINSPASRSGRTKSPTDYSHIKSRIDAGHSGRSYLSKSERLSSSTDYPHNKSRASTEHSRYSINSSTPDYSHIKSRIDSEKKSGSTLSESHHQRSESPMSNSKVSSFIADHEWKISTEDLLLLATAKSEKRKA